MSAFYSFEDILLAGLMFLIFSHLLRDYSAKAAKKLSLEAALTSKFHDL